MSGRKFCPKCNQLLGDEDTHCPMCGVNINKSSYVGVQISTIILNILPIIGLVFVWKVFNQEIILLVSKALQEFEALSAPTSQMGLQLRLVFFAVFLAFLTMAGLLVMSRKL